eukprot:jgi/Tetstr1/427251/TSEL_017438.t2
MKALQVKNAGHASILSEAQLLDLSEDIDEPGYPSALYLADLRSHNSEVDLMATNNLVAFNESSQCGNVVSKIPLLANGTVGFPEQEMLDHVSTKWVFVYNDYIRYAHMAMLVRWQGFLIASWQASPASRNLLVKGDGSKEIVVEGLQEQRLLYSVSRDFGKTWEMPSGIQLSDARSSELRGPVWSPVLHSARDGKLWLFYSQSRTCKRTLNKQVTWAPGGDIKAVTLKNVKSLSTGIFDSSDAPIWSMPKTILSEDHGEGLPKVIANKMIELDSGEWMLPFWREKPDSDAYVCMKDISSHPSAGVLISNDEGLTWTVHGVLRDLRTPLIEGAIVQLENGNILMLFRSASGCAWRSVSEDRGQTWNPVLPTRLPNPNSKMHVIRLRPSGHLILAFNNHKKLVSHLPSDGGQETQCRACRTELELAVSTNNGMTWRKLAAIDTSDVPGTRIHYPTLQQVDETLFVIYSKFFLYREPGEWSQEQGIRLAMFNISRLLETPANQVLRGVPSHRLLINLLNHFINSLAQDDIERLQAHGRTHRLAVAKRYEKRWRLLSAILSARYDLAHIGGQKWLHAKTNFGRYAVDRVWALSLAPQAGSHTAGNHYPTPVSIHFAGSDDIVSL